MNYLLNCELISDLFKPLKHDDNFVLVRDKKFPENPDYLI